MSPMLRYTGVLIAIGLLVLLGRRIANRRGARALLHHRARVDRFKLASRARVRAELLADPAIAAAINKA